MVSPAPLRPGDPGWPQTLFFSLEILELAREQVVARAAGDRKGDARVASVMAELTNAVAPVGGLLNDFDAAQTLAHRSDVMDARFGPGRWAPFAILPAEVQTKPRHYGEALPFLRPPWLPMPLARASEDDLLLVRHAVLVAIGQEVRRPLACHDVAAAIATSFSGCVMQGGHFLGQRGSGYAWGRRGDRHSWLRSLDGGILDASADQFGWSTLARISAGDPRQAWYEVLPPTLDADGFWRPFGGYIEQVPHRLPPLR